ncbi:hypothetical protein A3860_14810 [Niastella vici]|uniref:Type I restriction modification DNA specificity domain-containing protein n=1 Tax=Niastella vici TaxID=1703345 RepID=A0A1V9G5M5_9BACT|nr:restriction endonuclease subunit S [Niastella vici]OQP65862.1 hypothetical protein A3860_14810 [Niastella vici]
MNVPKNKKQLPESWEKVRLGEIATYINGKAFKPIDWSKEGLPIIRIQNLNKENSHFNYCNFKVEDKYYVKTGDLLFAWSGTPDTSFGAHIWKGENAVLNQHIFKIEIIEELIDKKYYLYALNNKVKEFVNKAHGTAGLAHITKKNFEDSEIFLPPKAIQQAIVSKIEELFSELDKGIEQLKIAQRQLKTYSQAVLKWAFEGRFTNENVKDGKLPEGWKLVKLDDVCSNVEYGSAAKSKEHGKIPVLRMGNIQNGRFDWNDLVYTDDDNEIKKYLLKKNDVLFNRTNSAELVGKTAIYKGERPAIFAGYLIRINLDKNLVDADYLNYYLNSKAAREYGNTVRTFGVNQSNINGTKLKTYPIPIAPLNEQSLIVQEIESRLSVADKIEETIKQSLQQAEALRQSILKKAFEGKLIDSDSIDTVKQEAKVIPLERKVLAGKIIHLLHDEKYFGLTKFQKTLYLVENYAEVTYETNFLQDRAGPHDKEFTIAFRKEMQDRDWVQEEQRGKITKFTPGDNIGSLIKDYAVYFREKGKQIVFVIQQLKDKSTHESELIATLYAVWNNRLIKKKPVKINLLVEDFFNWSPKKKEEFQPEEVLTTYKWMKQIKFVPSGFGKIIGTY